MNNLFFLSIQGSYSELCLSLYSGLQCLDSVPLRSSSASSSFLINLDKLLHRNNKELEDITFIGVDIGPGAFTSLRVIITIVNAIAYSSNIKLIGINGLTSLLEEIESKDSSNSKKIVVLNAYGNDVFYSYRFKNSLYYGYMNIDQFIANILKLFIHEEIVISGNAAEQVLRRLDNKDNIVLDSQNVVSCDKIAELALRKWKNKEYSLKLLPLYIKSQNFAINKSMIK